MDLLDVSKRPDRHKDLLDAAEAFGPCALICFERSDPGNIQRGNQLAREIHASPNGDIGWQIVDVGIMLTKHRSRLETSTREHLKNLLGAAIPPWSDREFGRGNVNHPMIATWIYAAAGAVLERPDYSITADQRLQSFIHIFSQAGDMSEYNSPTYLGPTLVGLANIGTYASLSSTRQRAHLIEERIWLSIMSRWHAPSQQLAGPHSRAYADSTLGFGGIIRYLCHAVLSDPVFWDTELAMAYDHDHDAEWAGKIAASIFHFPEYLSRIGEDKQLPYTVQSTTDCEDYCVHREEVYRGGWGELTTYLTPQYCLGSSQRPYVDGGQTESCIAYWQLQKPVEGFKDLRALYFRYIANNRLPGQENLYHNWYGGIDRAYSANLLHQDGRIHVLQRAGIAIILAQPLRRENGFLHSLRFDALLPVYTPLDEIWFGNHKVDDLPFVSGTDQPVIIRDHEIYLALRPLEPTRLDTTEPILEISIKNNHLIISNYNLRSDRSQRFAAHVLDNTHNGFVLEIGTKSEFGDFPAFRKHILRSTCIEQVWLKEYRRIRYFSGQDEMMLDYHPPTQTVKSQMINGKTIQIEGFKSPDAVQNTNGRLAIRDISLQVEPEVIAWMACDPASEWVTATLPTDYPSPLQLRSKLWELETSNFAVGKIRIKTGEAIDIEIDTAELLASFQLSGSLPIRQAVINGRIIAPKALNGKNIWELS